MEDKKFNYEVRSSRSQFETRGTENENPMISGYFVVFSEDFHISPDMSESIDRHALDNTLGNDIRALYDHDTAKVLGRTSNGTLQLRLDDHGLWGDITINPNDSEAMSVWQKVKRGDVNQCSFGFNILNEEPITREDGGTHWLLKEVDVAEISVVSFPAYETTMVTARSKQVDEIRSEKQKAWKENLLKKLKGEKDGTKSVDD